jgi:hypothetical protein
VPRLTNDVDLTLLTGFGDEEKFASRLLELFEPRFADAATFAVDHRVLLARTAGGVPIDIAFGGIPFEVRAVARAVDVEVVPGVPLRLCTASDLVVHKSFAARPQDWADVEGVLIRQRGALDWPQVWADLVELAGYKGEPGLVDQLDAIALRVEKTIGAYHRPRS